MPSSAMAAKLIEQVQKEWESDFIYLGMMAWCFNHEFDGFGMWFLKQAAEEREHGFKILRFLVEAGIPIHVPAVSQPGVEFAGIEDVFEKGLAHEQQVTQMYHELAEAAMAEKDHTTYQFLQWFISEQLEEENTFRDIVGKLRRIQGAPGGLFMLEAKLAARE